MQSVSPSRSPALITLLALAVSTLGQQTSLSLPSSATPAQQSSSPGAQTASPTKSLQTPATQDSTSNDQDGMFVFKKQVEEVVLHATVVDEKRHLAAHLDRTAFSVFEDGQPQAITSFHREDGGFGVRISIMHYSPVL